MAMTRYYLYAGYYELWITTKRLGAPLTLISWHKSLGAAERAAEKYDEFASVIYDSDLSKEMEYDGETADMSRYAA